MLYFHSQRKNGKSNYIHRYFIDHPSDCECPICRHKPNKQFLFCVATAYARYVYLDENEFDVDIKRSTFEDLFEYWQENRKNNKFLKNSQFYLDSARMLMWYSHFKWKYEKKYIHAKELLESLLRALDKVKHCDVALKQIVNCSIETLEKEVKRVKEKRPRKLTQRELCPEEWQRNDTGTIKKQNLKAIATNTKKINLLDMINSVDNTQTTNNQGIKFQIHDDDQPSSSASTSSSTPASTSSVTAPAIKKSTRGRPKKELETPVHTSSRSQKLKSNDQIEKTSDESKNDPASNKHKNDSTESEFIPPTPIAKETKKIEKVKRTRAKK